MVNIKVTVLKDGGVSVQCDAPANIMFVGAEAEACIERPEFIRDAPCHGALCNDCKYWEDHGDGCVTCPRYYVNC